MGARNVNYYYEVLMLAVIGTISECNECQFTECRAKTKHHLELSDGERSFHLQKTRRAWESFPKPCPPGKVGILFKEPILIYIGISLEISTSSAYSI